MRSTIGILAQENSDIGRRLSVSVTNAFAAEFAKVFPDLTRQELSEITSVPLPKLGVAKAVLGIVRSQMPPHDHRREPLPTYYHEWMDRYDRGEDMTAVYGVHKASAAA